MACMLAAVLRRRPVVLASAHIAALPGPNQHGSNLRVSQSGRSILLRSLVAGSRLCGMPSPA
jgi:hypothetical protein